MFKTFLTMMALAAAPAILSGAQIHNTSFYGVFGAIGANDDVTSATGSRIVNNISFTGTGCFAGHCPGEPGVATPPNHTVSDPITIRLTAAEFTCETDDSPCSANFRPIIEFATQNPLLANVVIDIKGTAPANFAGLSIDAFFQIGPPVFGGISMDETAVPVDGTGAFHTTVNLGTHLISNTYNKVDLFIRINNLGGNQTIFLPDSLNVTFTSAVPEPASVGMTVAGLFGLAWLARRKRR